MTFWIDFWTIFFAASLTVFAVVAVVVTVGGFFNIRSLFKSLTDQSSGQSEGASTPDGPGRS
jgi:hypothetical protein